MANQKQMRRARFSAALIAAIPAVLFSAWGINEVVSSLMLNYIWVYLGTWILRTFMLDSAAGFNASANRRIDAELCLVRLCEPEASLDAESLNARLCRVEERLARGVVPVAAAPQAAGTAGNRSAGGVGGAGGCPGAAAVCAVRGPAGLLAGTRQAAENDAPAPGAGHVLHAG